MMKNAQARTTYLKDYQPPGFTIETTDLDFDLYEDYARVTARLKFRRDARAGAQAGDSLVLDGDRLSLECLLLDGSELEPGQYVVAEESLTIAGLAGLLGREPDTFELECVTRLEPQNNTALEGLFKSGRMFCTQCEAEGFRRITYYLDRPDVMSRFTTRITAEKSRYPVLLSNGNRTASGVSEDDESRHWVTWEDPFKKPSYLFALVAGDLVNIDDSFTTCSGREIKLQIFVEEKDANKCAHAMTSLKNAMRWDEEVYGREYDLDIFMIVAVDDFNMGAMENKGLNIFNTSCVLANPKTTSDLGFQRVEAVVAHEYFHNWSGNRVTCRDWFQLSLKEGFTVFRDSEFSADMGSRTVKRIEEVNLLKTVQFAEDAGPMAHSVRPDSYMEIANFYTVTIYEKGAEVVRMIHQLLGEEKFRAGSDLYFERHDGQAVTTEDFVRAMEEASGIDLGQFRLWYTQAGTPRLELIGSYDQARQRYTLRVKQNSPPTPRQPNKQALLIPLRLGLLGASGEEIPLQLEGEEAAAGGDRVLQVREEEQEFVFINIPSAPVPSLLRGFSAPVRLDFDYTRAELSFLMVHDPDGFNRWNASQSLACLIMDDILEGEEDTAGLTLPVVLRDACAGVLDAALADPQLDRAMVAQLLSLPTEGYLIERANPAAVQAIHRVREFLADGLAAELQSRFAACYEACYKASVATGEFSVTADAMAERSLKNLALSYLVRSGSEQWIKRCAQQFNQADNMTDQLAALRCLVNGRGELCERLAGEALESFYRQWRDEALVVDQWFMVQAMSQQSNALERVEALLQHPDFNIRNPNKVRAVIGAFCLQNHTGFHRADGAGYAFLADRVLELDKLNPQIAARLLTPLTRWQKYEAKRQALMQTQLQRIKASPDLSRDVFEVVEKSTV